MTLSDAIQQTWGANPNPLDAAQAIRLLHRADQLINKIGMAKNHATRLMESERDGSTTNPQIKVAITMAASCEKIEPPKA